MKNKHILKKRRTNFKLRMNSSFTVQPKIYQNIIGLVVRGAVKSYFDKKVVVCS